MVRLGRLPRLWGLVGIADNVHLGSRLVPCRCVDRRRCLRVDDATQRAYGGSAIKCD